jgi:hypothetical protein
MYGAWAAVSAHTLPDAPVSARLISTASAGRLVFPVVIVFTSDG